MPMWGHSHSIHLNTAATLAIANSLPDHPLGGYNSLSDRVLQFDAYLFPLLDNRRGDPAGAGACVDVWRAG